MWSLSWLQILLKVDKTKEDKLAENNRNELLKFLNSSYDWDLECQGMFTIFESQCLAVYVFKSLQAFLWCSLASRRLYNKIHILWSVVVHSCKWKVFQPFKHIVRLCNRGKGSNCSWRRFVFYLVPLSVLGLVTCFVLFETKKLSSVQGMHPSIGINVFLENGTREILIVPWGSYGLAVQFVV